MNSLPNNAITNSENKIKKSISAIGNNNQITINAPQMPTAMCAEILKARENEIDQVRIENELLRLHIDHLAQDVARVRNILTEKDKYIAALIGRVLPPPPLNKD